MPTLHLSLKKNSNERLENLVRITGADSKAEVIGYALQIYDWLFKEIQNGKSLMIKNEDGSIVPINPFGPPGPAQ